MLKKYIYLFFKFDYVGELVGGGSVINGANPVMFYITIWKKIQVPAKKAKKNVCLKNKYLKLSRKSAGLFSLALFVEVSKVRIKS